ncbi:ATP-binding cassette domain-containing protein [Dactylosporangium sp. NPDC051485]|uniref:ATP-binding cassette domain-containing protein n=1 Tax=Dactylosporangium sp. NPDC051485 TaxID=3154846 RepID=UPI00344ABBC6
MTGIAVDVHGLTHRYGNATVLDAVDLRIASGSRHAIVGANGAGKTTLLGLIAGSGRPTDGRVRFDGRDVTDLPHHRRAQLGMSRTWQRPAVIDTLTAVDNIALAVRRTPLRSARRAAIHLLDQAGLGRAGNMLAAHLAYGQRRILELLTALASEPRLLILDEPSAGLSEQEVAGLLGQILTVSDATTLVVTDHSMALIEAVADVVTLLDGGRHAHTGEPSAVLAHLPSAGDLSASPAVHAPVAVTTREAVRARLQVRSLDASHGRHHVLRALTLSVYPGEITAIIGSDGSGRSTLVNILAGLHPAHRNARISLDGVDLTCSSAAQRARAGLTTVLQGTLPIPGLTVADELRLCGTDPRTAADALALPWIAARGRQRVETLSGGERQSLLVACALARRSAALVLDEPTEGMAGPVVDRLRDSLRRSAARQTAVLLTTTPSNPLLGTADRVLRLSNGNLHDA